jgi:hypothetical protein
MLAAARTSLVRRDPQPAAHMTSADLSSKRVDWLYEHFQGITRRSDQLLVLFGLLFTSSVAVLASPNDAIELPFLRVEAGRHALLGSAIFGAVFTLLAFFGNYDYGERALRALCSELGCDYGDLWFVNTHPTLIDFIRFRRDEDAARRGYAARLGAQLLYPIVLLSAFAWISAIWTHEMWHSLKDMTPIELATYALAFPGILIAWDRAIQYLERRWRTFRRSEAVRTRARSDGAHALISNVD